MEGKNHHENMRVMGKNCKDYGNSNETNRQQVDQNTKGGTCLWMELSWDAPTDSWMPKLCKTSKAIGQILGSKLPHRPPNTTSGLEQPEP